MERLGVPIDEHEIGYIALHIHSALEKENVSQAMNMAQAVRTCISMVEKEARKKIDVLSLSYNRLMNHIRYMVLRVQKVCDQLGEEMKLSLSEEEVGYLAMHIERITVDERA